MSMCFMLQTFDSVCTGWGHPSRSGLMKRRKHCERELISTAHLQHPPSCTWSRDIAFACIWGHSDENAETTTRLKWQLHLMMWNVIVLTLFCRYGIGKWRLIQKDDSYGPQLVSRSNVDLKVSQLWLDSMEIWLCSSLLLVRKVFSMPLFMTCGIYLSKETSW